MVSRKKKTARTSFLNPGLPIRLAGALALVASGLLTTSAAETPVPAVSPAASPVIPKDPKTEIQGLCKDLRESVKKLNWKVEPCPDVDWKVGGWSWKGRPLIYAEFGNPAAQNTTVVLSMIHGDEATPLYLGLQLLHWLKENQASLGNARVVVAPLVNPDGFYRKPPTRTNGHSVDVNRNFATRDWHERALKLWKTKFKGERRRFPGHAPRSEPETIFQEDLIHKFRPNKLLAIHAPLNFTDYDGPTPLSLDRFPNDYVQECLKLKKKLKATSGGFFPGSLGNYAGQELGIPTITLELPTANPKKAEAYWKQFRSGIHNMIEFTVPDQTASLFRRTGT